MVPKSNGEPGLHSPLFKEISPMSSLVPNSALNSFRKSIEEAVPVRSAREAIARDVLSAHFQPIVDLRNGTIAAHESLIRGPRGNALGSPDALFATARSEGLTLELERHCLTKAFQAWSSQGLGSRLFVNLSAHTLVILTEQLGASGVVNSLRSADVPPAALVIEITEHDHIADLKALVSAVAVLRAEGIQLALDDFGHGHSNLLLWAELQPEIVKIDKYFIKGSHSDAVKVQMLKGLLRFAETFGTTMVAEGIETAEELKVVRDLGIQLGQGYFLGRPEAIAAQAVSVQARAVITSTEIAVLPESTRAAGADFRVERLAKRVPPLDQDSTIDDVARLFGSDESLRALAVVAGGKAIGLLNRQGFLNQYAKPFFRELYGRKPCLLFANTSPLMLDKHTGLDALTEVLTSPDQRYLSEGFIVTEGGCYFGLGTGEQLVRVVTEVRMEAARHANPLTFLPGNIPITEHIARLLASCADFVACYADLNDFKPYNDHYGYWRGDEMIRLQARSIVSKCDPRRDFIGHVGGDDFVVLFQSEDWLDRCEQTIAFFNEQSIDLFDADAKSRGGIEGEDRHGVMRFFKFTTLSIGAVRVRAGQFSKPEQVASAAAAAKHRAKASAMGLIIQSD